MGIGTILLIAAGGALAFEGALWAIFPNGVRQIYRQTFEQMNDRDLHMAGLVSVALGVGLIVLAVKVTG